MNNQEAIKSLLKINQSNKDVHCNAIYDVDSKRGQKYLFMRMPISNKAYQSIVNGNE